MRPGWSRRPLPALPKRLSHSFAAVGRSDHRLPDSRWTLPVCNRDVVLRPRLGLAVHPTNQGAGLARKLMACCARAARAMR